MSTSTWSDLGMQHDFCFPSLKCLSALPSLWAITDILYHFLLFLRAIWIFSTWDFHSCWYPTLIVQMNKEDKIAHLWSLHKSVTVGSITKLIYARSIAVPLPLHQHCTNWAQIIQTDPNSSLKCHLITWEGCKTGLACIPLGKYRGLCFLKLTSLAVISIYCYLSSTNMEIKNIILLLVGTYLINWRDLQR